jgi:hypothetical protein
MLKLRIRVVTRVMNLRGTIGPFIYEGLRWTDSRSPSGCGQMGQMRSDAVGLVRTETHQSAFRTHRGAY